MRFRLWMLCLGAGLLAIAPMVLHREERQFDPVLSVTRNPAVVSPQLIPASGVIVDPVVSVAGASLDDDPPGGQLAWEWRYGEYWLRSYTSGLVNGEYVAGKLEIWQRGVLVYSDESDKFLAPTYDEDAELPPVGADLTGRGLPNVVIRSFSGGAHCSGSGSDRGRTRGDPVC